MKVNIWCKKKSVIQDQSQEGNGKDFKILGWQLSTWLVPKLARSGMGIVHRTGSF